MIKATENVGGPPRAYPAFALTLAALLVLVASTWASVHKAGDHTGPLAMLALALVLAIVAIAGVGAGSRLESRKVAALRGSRWVLAALIMLHGLIACRMVLSSIPNIDCYTFQRDAALSLLHGVNPFGTSHDDIYKASESSQFYGPGMVVDGRVQVGLQYPPLTLLCALPGFLLGDVRFGYILVILLSAIIVYALAPDARGFSLVAFLLLNPLTYVVEYQCWTEPLPWMLLCATLYAAVKRPRWLPLALGLFLASKQYNVLALPLIGLLLRPFAWRSYWRLLSLSLAIAAATLLPFALWNFRALWHDLVLFHLAQPFRHDALSFAVPFPLVLKIGPLVLLGFMAWAALRAAHHAAVFAAGYGATLLLFFSASKQAFFNYYFLIWQAFLLAAVLWPTSPAVSARSYPTREASDPHAGRLTRL